jgi:hypothetical protein
LEDSILAACVHARDTQPHTHTHKQDQRLDACNAWHVPCVLGLRRQHFIWQSRSVSSRRRHVPRIARKGVADTRSTPAACLGLHCCAHQGTARQHARPRALAGICSAASCSSCHHDMLMTWQGAAVTRHARLWDNRDGGGTLMPLCQALSLLPASKAVRVQGHRPSTWHRYDAWCEVLHATARARKHDILASLQSAMATTSAR